MKSLQRSYYCNKVIATKPLLRNHWNRVTARKPLQGTITMKSLQQIHYKEVFAAKLLQLGCCNKITLIKTIPSKSVIQNNWNKVITMKSLQQRPCHKSLNQSHFDEAIATTSKLQNQCSKNITTSHFNKVIATQPLQQSHCNKIIATKSLQQVHCNEVIATNQLQWSHCY